MMEIIHRAIEGDAEATTILYRTYAPKIYRYVSYRVPTDADAEDLTAEVFLRMVAGLPEYRITGAPFESWLYRIAIARVADWHRGDDRKKQVQLSDTIAADIPLPEDLLEQKQDMEDLWRLIRQHLTGEQQTVLILRFVERKRHKEVATLMGKSAMAVKTIQYRALMQLAGLLGARREKSHHCLGGQKRTRAAAC